MLYCLFTYFYTYYRVITDGQKVVASVDHGRQPATELREAKAEARMLKKLLTDVFRLKLTADKVDAATQTEGKVS